MFTDLGTVDRRMEDNATITQEYFSSRGNWVRCSLIPVEKNEFGGNTKILFGFRNINAEKKRLESQDNVIQALTMTYDNAYAVNTDTSEAVCYRMDKVITDLYGKKFAIGNYDANIKLYMMPEMNGYEATMAIRSIQGRPDARNIPIIALTANAFVEDVQASLDAGMNGHLAKPIVMEEVIGTIARQVHK